MGCHVIRAKKISFEKAWKPFHIFQYSVRCRSEAVGQRFLQNDGYVESVGVHIGYTQNRKEGIVGDVSIT